MKIREAFCANCQEVKEHQVTIDSNGEFLFTCDCGRFFKLPGELDETGINEALANHAAVNAGQVTQADIEAANAEKLSNI